MSVTAPSAPAIPGTTEHWATLEAGRMRYLRAGSGPPLLLIHGLLGYSFSWRFNFEPLGRVRDVIAPDLLGNGFSDRPRELDCTLEECACRMLQLMDTLEIDSFDLLGTSHGGGVAALMAALSPERVKKLVLVAPVNPWSKHGKWVTRALGTQVACAVFKSVVNAFRSTNKFWLARLYGDAKRIAPGTLEGYMQPLLINGTWDYGLSVISTWHADLAVLATAYPRIRHETLLMWGDRDTAVFMSSAEDIERVMPQARLKIFSGVGHMPYEEVPDEFNRALLDFLE